MSKCPVCGAQLPDEAHFCMHCFTSFDAKNVDVPAKKALPVSRFFKSKTFRVCLMCVLSVALLAIGANLLKKAIKPTAAVPSDAVVIVTVTDEHGELVTHENGEAVTQATVAITDESGEAVTDASGAEVRAIVAPVTDASGEAVTDQSGGMVYEAVTDQTQANRETTSKKGLFSQLFGRDEKTTEPAVSTTVTSLTATTVPSNTSAQKTETTERIPQTTEPLPASTTQTTLQTTPQTTPQTTAPINSRDFTYTESGGKITITAYNGNASKVTVPAYIDGKPVVYVGEGAFSNKSNISSIVFESGTHEFQFLYFTNVFNNLPNLKEIVFPQNTKAYALASNGVEYHTLYFYKMIEDCDNISGIYFGSKDQTQQGALYSDNGVVYNRGALEYYPPKKTDSFYALDPNCTAVEGAAFRNNPYLKHLQFGKSLNYIRTGRDSKQLNFLGCSAIEKFSVADGNTHYSAKDGVLFYRPDGTINGITYYSFHYPPAKTDTYFEMIDKPMILSDSFCGNPYIETVKFSDKVYFDKIEKLRGTASSPDSLKKIVLAESPVWYAGSKLSEMGIKVEIVSE